MPILPPGWAQVTMLFTRSGDPEPMANVWGVDVQSIDPSEYGQLGDAFADAFMAACKSGIDDSVVNTGVKVLIGNDGEPFSFEFARNEAGTDSYPIVPQNTAILVRKITARPGRRGRGRAFLPWVAETSVSDSGVLTGSYVTSWQAKIDDFANVRLLAAGTGLSGDLRLAVLHAGEGPGSEVPDLVVSLIVSPLVATQRRRLRR